MDWQDLVAAALPIAIAWLLWRLQAVSVNQVLRGGMYKLLRYQRATYSVVSWFGVLMHEISHAVVLLLGGHGIRGFRIGVDSGHVTPRQVRKGAVGTLTFIAAALAPMVATPAAVLGLLWLLPRSAWPPGIGAGTGLAAVRVNFEETLVGVPILLVSDLVGMDVTTWAGAALLALAVFAMPSARPSHVKNKGADEGDIAVVRNLIRRRPIPVLVFAALLYASYFLVTPWWPAVYWRAWQVVWMVALVGIVLAILMGVVWYGVAWTGRIKVWAAWIPYAALVGVQVAGRFLDQAIWITNLASIAMFVGLAWGLRTVAARRI